LTAGRQSEKTTIIKQDRTRIRIQDESLVKSAPVLSDEDWGFSFVISRLIIFG